MRKHFSASLVALSFVLTLSLTAVAQDANYNNKNTLPEIGVVASDAISLDKEMIVGDAVMRQMRGQSPIISDPVLAEYLQDIGSQSSSALYHHCCFGLWWPLGLLGRIFRYSISDPC